MNEEFESVRAQSAPKIHTYMDLLLKQSNNIMLKSVTSDKINAPRCSFGKAQRESQLKIYQDKETQKLNGVGRDSPGPKYLLQINKQQQYKMEPRAIIGTQERQQLNLVHYNHYDRKNQLQLNESDILRRYQQPINSIGLQSRISKLDKNKFLYDININPIKIKAPIYSIAKKRSNSTYNQTSTPNLVGPGRYLRNKLVHTSEIQNQPKYSIPQATKQNILSTTLTETYDIRQGIGTQIKSDKKTNPSYSIGKQNRDKYSGYFQDQMYKVQKPIRIQHSNI